MKREMEIVLIEDNEDDAHRMMCFLRRHFTNDIRLIQDGAEAVNFLLFENDSKPKLILLDVVLPSVDGIELYNIIRAEPKERDLSVVMLISSDKSKEYLNSLNIKPDGYMRKPKGESIPCRLAD